MFFGEIPSLFEDTIAEYTRPFIFRSRRVSGLVFLSNWWSLLQLKSNRFLFSCKMGINRQDGRFVDSTHDCNYSVYILSYIYFLIYIFMYIVQWISYVHLIIRDIARNVLLN